MVIHDPYHFQFPDNVLPLPSLVEKHQKANRRHPMSASAVISISSRPACWCNQRSDRLPRKKMLKPARMLRRGATQREPVPWAIIGYFATPDNSRPSHATPHSLVELFKYSLSCLRHELPVTFRCIVWSLLRAVNYRVQTPTVRGPNYSLVTSLPTVEEVLDDHASELGHDLIAYRVPGRQFVPRDRGDSRVELEKIAVAAVFHDLGIWTNNTFDYIAPSVAIARKHLADRGMAEWIPEIEAMC